MFRQVVIGLTVIPTLAMTAATVCAQRRTTTLSELLPQLHGQVIAAEDMALGPWSYNQEQETRKARLDTVLHINTLLADQLSSFPLGSSAGGFTWTFEPKSATLSRASDSFGPIFSERALTIGRNRVNVGVNYQRVTFDHLEGKRLRGGEIVGYTGLPDDGAATGGVFFAEALDLQLTTDTISVFATYGVTDRLDVGVTVPVNRVDMKATLVSQFGDTVTGTSSLSRPEATAQCIDYWVPWLQRVEVLSQPSPVIAQGCGLRAEAAGSATGIGDVVVRAKYRFLTTHGGGVAAGVDVRLPTADERNLLGIGGAQAKGYLALSSGLGRLSPHVNIGYTVSGESDAVRAPGAVLMAPPDEVNYAGGAEVVLSLRATVALDVVGRTLRKAGTLNDVPSLFGSRNGDRSAASRLFNEFRVSPEADLNLLLGSAGIKVNATANLLTSVNVLFPLSSRGLTDKFAWLLGFDYSF
jgi:hypothetical protein